MKNLIVLSLFILLNNCATTAHFKTVLTKQYWQDQYKQELRDRYGIKPCWHNNHKYVRQHHSEIPIDNFINAMNELVKENKMTKYEFEQYMLAVNE